MFLFVGLPLEGAPAKGTKPKAATAPAAVGGDSAGGAAIEEAGEPAEPISFSGIWMAGREEDWERRFPVAKDVVMLRRTQADGFSKSFELSKALLNAFQASKRGGGNRIVDGLTLSMGSAKDGRGLVMACVVNHEYTHGRTVGSGKGAVRTVFADVFADLVICNFSNLSVVARVPFRVSRKGIVRPGKSEADAGLELLSDIYSIPPNEDFMMGGDGHKGLKYWIDRKNPLKDNGSERNLQMPIHLVSGMVNAAKYAASMTARRKVAIRKVTVMPDAESALHSYFHPFKEEYFASLFSSNFFDGTGLSTLPFSRGDELVFSMMVEELSDANLVGIRSGREAETRNVKFALSRPDYDLELVIPTFMTVPRGDIAQVCAYSRITIKQSDVPIYSAQHDANQQVVLARGTKGTSWEAYADATSEMFFRAGSQMLKLVDSKDINEPKPVRVVRASELRDFFLWCAPGTIIKK